MATKPSIVPEWCEDGVDGVDYAQPSPAKQQYGQAYGQNTTRFDINYQWREIAQWIKFFEGTSLVDDVFITADTGKTVAEVEAQKGGQWDFIDGATGADTLAGENVIVFKRIA